MNNSLIPRRNSADSMSSQYPHINGNNGSRSSRGLGSSGGRRLGSAPPQLRTVKLKNRPLAIFRIIIITIILLCTTWVYLIIKIASGMNSSSSGGEAFHPSAMLARPHIDLPKNLLSDIGWAVKQKIHNIMITMKREHPVPLLDVSHLDSPVLIITYKRADYLERTLWNIFESHPAQQVNEAKHTQQGGNLRKDLTSNDQVNSIGRIVGAPIIISQDGPNREVRAVIETYRHLFESKLGVPLYSLEHPRTIVKVDKNPKVSWKASYISLAAHLGWAIEQTFSGKAYDNYLHRQMHNRDIPSELLPLPQRVIILEEDIEISNDFFSLMNATADILDEDETLLAVSAFNDNGKEQFVSDPKRLVRSDFFPGLGWMMARSVWDGPASHSTAGLKSNWAPGGFWDDWLRDSDQRRGRQILRPEVSRTFHFGIVDGTSKNQNDEVLNKIELVENHIRWEDVDLSYLDASSYADSYWNRVSQAKLVEHLDEAKRDVAHGDVRIVYNNLKQFNKLAKKFGVMDDEKAGVPRTGYEGIVEIRYGRGEYFIYLTPPCIVNGRPEHFGKRAWLDYNKVSLMRDLGYTT